MSNGELEHSVQHMSADYDDLKTTSSSLAKDLKRIDKNLTKISMKVYEIDDAIEALTAYSYQYNIKILGIPQTNENETAQDTVEICLKLFSELKANVHDCDIDIAHRVKSRNNDSKPIVHTTCYQGNCHVEKKISERRQPTKHRILRGSRR